jgi:hypothetical protein
LIPVRRGNHPRDIPRLENEGPSSTGTARVAGIKVNADDLRRQQLWHAGHKKERADMTPKHDGTPPSATHEHENNEPDRRAKIMWRFSEYCKQNLRVL